MKIVILHADEATEPPIDPVLGQVKTALGELGHDATLLAVDAKLEATIDQLRRVEPDLIFNLAESFAGRSALESSIAGLLNLLDLRYTGSSASGLMLAGDKSIATRILRAAGLRTAESATLFRGAVETAGSLHFPVILKPPQEDASIGITSKSVVSSLDELFAQMDEMQSEFSSPILVEEFIEGREFYVGVLGNQQPEALPMLEMDFTGFPSDRPKIASWSAKWGEDGDERGAEYAGTRSVFPENVGEDLAEQIQQVAIDAFRALRLRDYARIDLRVRPNGEIYVLEVNPNCYLEREAEFARAALKSGLEYRDLIARIVELASARYAR
ncbi:MAG TPA: ATP-grasp domain-containing protein [Gemmatimonadaceae bacterium]